MSQLKNSDFETLLPDYRTSYERAYEEGIKEIVKSDDFFDWLIDPMKTKTELLDILAKEAGVIDWYDSDLDIDKRRSIRDAPSIHKKKGTIKGIQEGLEALGCRATVTRNEKYSLHIHNLVTDKQLTLDLHERLYERINSSKSLRDVFELVIGRLWLGQIYKSAQVVTGRHIMIKAAE
ncbi:phage tail protein I [Vibrio hannami]|uniref:phage tail protein I n=1 Tax=Vibrio hannami TaxID=2717094 RepID=UPI002410699A|nr:phage tail protein I [Vibrio hannami]MDG3089129.1 phage tail protein I [Vibrio hannami]